MSVKRAELEGELLAISAKITVGLTKLDSAKTRLHKWLEVYISCGKDGSGANPKGTKDSEVIIERLTKDVTSGVVEVEELKVRRKQIIDQIAEEKKG
ncbi:MAG: hypothetical protein LQ347_001620 [Umbilicaria vellea]|nr:MAG: hypothetical protein LQ347_001620 [Umbilicaria vellea]